MNEANPDQTLKEVVSSTSTLLTALYPKFDGYSDTYDTIMGRCYFSYYTVTTGIFLSFFFSFCLKKFNLVVYA